MNMKAINFFKYILVAALTLSFVACEEEPWGPGEQDLLDCHGLFFPQEQALDYEATPGEAEFITLVAERTLDEAEAYVPYELISEDGFFFMEDEFIYFDEDQKRSIFKVYFSDEYETGKKYTCTIKVTDPQYVANYGLSSNELTFSVTIVDWESMGEGLWRDDFFSSYVAAIGAEIKAPYHEKKVSFYQRKDLPGYYRVDNVFSPDFISYMVDGNTDNVEAYKDFCPAPSLYINATNPDKVYIDFQFAFVCPSGQYGEVYICSDVEEVFDSGYSNLYGTLKDGSITFPKNSLVAYLPSAGAAYANVSGKQRIVLPGYEPYDFSVAVEVSPSTGGVLPVEFTLGPNVANVQYKFFEGHLSDVDMVSKLDEVKKGAGTQVVSASGVYELTLPKTGLYTIIACSFDAKGEFKEYAVQKFGYDSATDPKDVDIHLGLIVSNKYAGAGLTDENSMEFYVYGTEITNAKVAMYKKANYDDFRESIEKEFQYYIPALEREQLAQLNGIGYTGVINNLDPGTEYVLVVEAGNGYHSGVFTTTAFTAGEFDLMDAEYGIYDIPERLQGVKEDYFKDWELWSLNPYTDFEWGRTKRSTVTFAEDEDIYFDENGKVTEDESKADVTYDYVSLSGMYPNAAEKYGFEDKIQLEFYEGFVYTIMTQIGPGEYKGTPVYPTTGYLFFDGQQLTLNLENGAMVGGFLTEEKDAIAFVGNPATTVGQYGYSYFVMMLCYFADAGYTSFGDLIEEDCHAYPLLLAPGSKYATEDGVSELKAPAACNKVSVELAKARTNYVETERGYIMSTIDRVKDAPYNYMLNMQEIEETSTSAPSGLGAIVRTLRQNK